ncbi:MAG: NAD(P)H-hydrate dehydratase [Bacteriovoracaceae bacterium]|nr:NAD(P)H-hydrate dehydratase [Bacteriovoracaceae bacterium]
MKSKKVSRSIYKFLPKRSKFSHKGSSGRVVVCGGNALYLGAGVMSSLSAMRAGAGYTVLVSDAKKFSWFENPDIIVRDFQFKALKDFQGSLFLLGPGMGTDQRAQKFFQQFLKTCKNEMALIDADALTLLAKIKNKKYPLPSEWILTPHEGELARLLNKPISQVKNNRVQSILDAYAKYQCTILLKGHETLIYDGSTLYRITNGEMALAKAGTGDVLAGMIAAFRAQGLSSSKASILGATLHNDCAKMLLKKGFDQISLRPVDLIDILPMALKKYRK